MDLLKQSLFDTSKMLKKKDISSRELTELCLKKIESTKDSNAYITVCGERALEQADAVDAKRVKGEKLSDLAGIPISLKDNICTKGVLTTCASKHLSDFVPCYDATVTEILNTAGAVLVGKTNMDEFALGSSGETSYYGGVANPYDKTRVAGGSSSGSAASVALGTAYASLGTDTGGSVRLPAAFCGVVGFKPTYGMISRNKIAPLASSLDTVGILTRTVFDSCLMLDALKGGDCGEETSLRGDYEELAKGFSGGIEGQTFGLIREAEALDSDKEVVAMFEKAKADIKAKGGKVIEISLPSLMTATQVYSIISLGELASNLASLDGIRYGMSSSNPKSIDDMYLDTRSDAFGHSTKLKIMIGNYVLSAKNYEDYFLKALKIRKKLSGEINAAFEKCDLLLMPTTPAPAFTMGEKMKDTMKMYAADILNVPANLAGIPAITVPYGATKNGMPLGIQLYAKALQDAKLLHAAGAVMNETGR